MSEFFANIWDAILNGVLASISISDIIDMAIITFAIYQVLKLFKGTKAMQLLKGIAILIIALALATWLGLSTTTWLLNSVFTSGIVVLVIIFQPELRRVFESIGRGDVFTSSTVDTRDAEKAVNEIVTAASHLSHRHVGALIVFKQHSSLDDIITTGVTINAEISNGLLENIFEPNTPLHDGATVITGTRITAAGCFLPLSENNDIEKTLGTRHRAALGISERTDAIVLVVSEETGTISCAHSGELERYLDLDALTALLARIFVTESAQPKTFIDKVFSRFFGKENKNGNQG